MVSQRTQVAKILLGHPFTVERLRRLENSYLWDLLWTEDLWSHIRFRILHWQRLYVT